MYNFSLSAVFLALMDDDALNMRNWGYYEPSFKGHLGLQLMSSMAEQRDTKAFLPGRDPTTVMVSSNGTFHTNHPRDCVVSDAPVPMNYVRDSWVNQRDKFLNMLPPNTNYGVLPETSGAHSLQMLQPPEAAPRDERVVGRIEEPVVNKESGPSKKRQGGGGAPKAPKVKKPRKPKENNNSALVRVKPAKKSMDVVINGIDMDISGIPIPVCSCTGTPQQCYRWGCGGWQSACCTTNVSVYPLPMSTKRRGARIAGRKMSQGAFKKVLEKLAAEGYNFANPIDLRAYWARHGTNKFVTIR
ncbi:protein BASIC PENTACYSTEINE2-like isoform X1 [Humulus lupulus]|uniref:protein BASIC PENTACYSTEINE2-like isoform X1 n=2 Tax=Humulus lupulus TaxID=3486 RepID=UPI002B4074C2|nr:protein BASIC PENTACYSTEINE2-like isoform X1 [Humulus lupulus]